MARAVAAFAILLLAVAGSWNHDLWAYDEPREVELARSMYRSGDWVVMHLGDRPFLDKPPLFCESVAASFAVAGHPSVLLARLVTAAWALGTLGVTAWAATRLLGRGSGIVAALVLATAYRFYALSHEVLLDNALTTFTTAAIALGAVAVRERSRGLAALAAAALAGAFLTKGFVGVGIAGLVLLVDLVARRDLAGLRVLLHPLSWLALAAPLVVYLLALDHAAGSESRSFLVELFWSNQFGRFLGTHGQKASAWYLYAEQWPEMLGVWTPIAALAVAQPLRDLAREGVKTPRQDTLRMLLIWAIVPLVVLSFSKGRARAYALPVVPAYALLVAAFWQTASKARALVTAAVVGGALLVAGAVLAIGVLAPDRLDALEVTGALLALGVAGAWLARGRDEDGAIALGLVVLAGFLVSSGRFVAARLDRSRSYGSLAREALAHAHGRTLRLFHVSNSYSGAFAFEGDRTTPEYDAGYDQDGSRLLHDLGPAEREVALGPVGALGLIPAEKRRDLVVLWLGLREDDAADEWRAFALFARRPADAAPRDPLPTVGAPALVKCER